MNVTGCFWCLVLQVWLTDSRSTPNSESSSGSKTSSSPLQTHHPCKHRTLFFKIIFFNVRSFSKTAMRQYIAHCTCSDVFRYLQADPENFDLRDLKCKFDVILLEPPLEEYYRESGIIASERFWTWDDVSAERFSLSVS